MKKVTRLQLNKIIKFLDSPIIVRLDNVYTITTLNNKSRKYLVKDPETKIKNEKVEDNLRDDIENDNNSKNIVPEPISQPSDDNTIKLGSFNPDDLVLKDNINEPINKPKGWHSRNEFMDNEGNVFNKGIYIGSIVK